MAAGIGCLLIAAARGVQGDALTGDGERNAGSSRHEQIRRVGSQCACIIRTVACRLHGGNPGVIFFLHAYEAVERAALVVVAGVVERQHYRRCLVCAERAVQRYPLHTDGSRYVHGLE